MSKFGVEILTLIIIIFLIFTFHTINKNKCEQNGGIYIWELGNRGSMCHFK